MKRHTKNKKKTKQNSSYAKLGEFNGNNKLRSWTTISRENIKMKLKKHTHTNTNILRSDILIY